MKKKTKPKVKLTPPDPKQCQCEKREGTLMSLGGSPNFMKRCTKKPVFIATENQLGDDGQAGSMSLCAECAESMKKQLGADFATLVPIKPEKVDTKKRTKEVEANLQQFLDFFKSLPAGWLGKTTGDIGLLNKAYIEARRLGMNVG